MNEMIRAANDQKKLDRRKKVNRSRKPRIIEKKEQFVRWGINRVQNVESGKQQGLQYKAVAFEYKKMAPSSKEKIK